MASVEITTADLLAHVRELEEKARNFDGLLAAVESAAEDFTRYCHSWSGDYNRATEKASNGGDGAKRAAIFAEHALGKASAYRLASEVLGELVEIWGNE